MADLSKIVKGGQNKKNKGAKFKKKKAKKIDGGLKVCRKKLILVLLLFQWYIFYPYRFFKFTFDVKLHFSYFQSLCWREKRESCWIPAEEKENHD